jgi:hypothetical protein
MGPFLVARSVRDVWAATGSGPLWQTLNDGVSWSRVRVPLTTTALGIADGLPWELSCYAGSNDADFCRPTLKHLTSDHGWQQMKLPRVMLDVATEELVVNSAGVLAIVTGGCDDPHGWLLSSVDGGRTWMKEHNPAWQPGRGTLGAQLATAGTRHWWVLCPGEAALMHDTKAVYLTDDRGKRWILRSQLINIASSRGPHSLPGGSANALAAASPWRLWLALYNGFVESGNGGASWSPAKVGPGGAPAYFDVLSPDRVWLLAQGVGLWHTTNGRTWKAMGAVHY